MPEEVVTLEQANLDEGLGEPQEGKAKTIEAEELDYKAEYERLTAELEVEKAAREKQERDQRARDIQLLSQKQQQEIQAKIAQNTEAILNRLESGELTRAEAQKAISQGVASIQTEAAAGIERETLTRTLVDTQKQLSQRSVALGTGEKLEDPRAQNVVLFWNEAINAHRAGKLEVAEVRRNDALREMERLEAELKANPRAGGLSINERGARGAAAGMSDQTWLDHFADEEGGGIPSTPENRTKAQMLWGKGIRPHALRR